MITEYTVENLSKEDLKKLFRKHKITARKHEGDDQYSWAVFVNNSPKFLGLSRSEVDYYKKLVLKIILPKEKTNESKN
jgi:hypothetical protein